MLEFQIVTGEILLLSPGQPVFQGRATVQGVADAIAMLSDCGDFFHSELLRAVAQARIDLVHVVDRDVILPKLRLRRLTRPILLLLGDDDYASTGASGWRCAAAAMQWAANVIVHASGGEPQHYATAVAAAEHSRRLLMVETSARSAQSWIRAARGKPLHLIYPRDGLHPVQPRPEELQ